MPSREAVFLDKDGTMLVNLPANTEIRFADGAVDGLRRLQAEGFRLVVVTNQGGVARGEFSEDDLLRVRRRLGDLCRMHGVRIDGFYYCPHDPDGSIPRYSVRCDCRKPLPGMVLRACEELSIDPARSWFVGDILNDVEAGRRAGCRAVLLDVGNETEWTASPFRYPDFIAKDIRQAADLILAESRGRRHAVR